MSLHQSAWAKGRKQAVSPSMAGQIVNVLFIYDIGVGADGALTAADKVEIGTLPAGAKVVDAVLSGVTGGACTATLGIMSGDAGANDAARTVGTDFFAATSINGAATRMSALTAFDVATSDVDRGIGCTISANVAETAGRYIKASVSYRLAATQG